MLSSLNLFLGKIEANFTNSSFLQGETSHLTVVWLKSRVYLNTLNAGVLLCLHNLRNMAVTGDKLSYGWLRFRPTWLQFLNTPKWFLFFLSQYFFTQSIVVNGVYPGSISTIEKRFGFSRLVCLLPAKLQIGFLIFRLYIGWVSLNTKRSTQKGP